MVEDWAVAQAAVIGAALIDDRCVPEILAEMRPEDFLGEYRRFFEAIARLTAEDTVVDPVTVLNIVGQEYTEFAHELIKITPTAANVQEYIQICKEQSRLRLLRDCGAALSGAATLDEARAALAKAEASSLEVNRQTSWTAVECAVEYFDRLHRNEKPDFIKTGFDCLDDAMMVLPGNLIVVAGYTANGKTALALQMALGVSQTKRVGFFSYEMTKEELVERLLSHVSRVDYKRIQKMELTPDEEALCARSATRIPESLCFEHSAGFTVDAIRSQTRRCGYEVIFVDYVQYVASADSRASDYQRVTAASMGLKLLAQQLHIPVFAMAQLSREVKSTEEFVPFPKLRDLRESGQIEQDANVVLFTHAPFPQTKKSFRSLYIAKNRKGETASFFYTFLGGCQTFRPPTAKEAEDYAKALEEQRAKSQRRQGKAKPAASPWSPAGAPVDVVADGVLEQSELPM